MAEPGSLRELAEQVIFAAVGGVVLTAERIDRLADELASARGLRREEARGLVEDVLGRWRGDAARAGERAGVALENVFRELGVATRADLDELELRVAQLEHRLRLLERPAPPAVP